jgi:hypothetical protein
MSAAHPADPSKELGQSTRNSDRGASVLRRNRDRMMHSAHRSITMRLGLRLPLGEPPWPV